MLILCRLCHHQEPHYARSLCRRCYNKAYARGELAALPYKTAHDRRLYWREWKRQWRAMKDITL
jgi:hypothetical protein